MSSMYENSFDFFAESAKQELSKTLTDKPQQVWHIITQNLQEFALNYFS